MSLNPIPFLGSEDLDSPSSVLPRGHHRTARNILFRGPVGNRRAESMPGTTLRPNTLPAGTNKSIGAFYDSVKARIICFNYNSNGVHGIYIYNTQTSTWQTLLVNGSGTDGDILGFNPNVRIDSVDVLYGEATDGDLLFYVDSLGRPTCFNIDRYLNTPYAVTKRSYIDVAKAPPIMPARVTYENDTTVSVNNLKNALFQFRYRFVYDDYQKSVWSTGSIVPLPLSYYTQTTDTDPTLNSRISVYLSTGDETVRKIEIAVRQITDAKAEAAGNGSLDVLGNYGLVTVLNKSQLIIPNNDVWRFVFKNSSIYPPIDPREANLLFDYVPQKANCGALLNGDVPIYGGVTEGYDVVPVRYQVSNVEFLQPSYLNGVLFFASQAGTDSGGTGTQLKITLTGAGYNDASGNPYQLTGVIQNSNFQVNARANDNTVLTFNYINIPLVTSIPAILASLSTAAQAKGFTVVSTGPNTLVLNYAAGFTLFSSFCSNSFNVNIGEAGFVYAGQEAYQMGIQYYDKYGRTNGTSLSQNSSGTTVFDSSDLNVTNINLRIMSRPPIWAYYYDLVRTPKITYGKRLYWVSNQTFVSTDVSTGVQYAYIGITYMSDYDQNIEAATNIVSYEFAQGDRIKFLMRFDSLLNPINLFASFDFEIVSSEVDPVVQGVIKQGTFLKIKYPTGLTSINFDFADGNPSYQWYKILIYNYVKHSDQNNIQVFYEFGRRFGIGNPGTGNAYHIGYTQSQTPDLTTPAIIGTGDGQYFYRFRTVPVGQSFYPVAGDTNFKHVYQTCPMAITPIVVNNITVNSQTAHDVDGLDASSFPQYTDGNPLITNAGTSPVKFRIRSTKQYTSDHNAWVDIYLKIVNSDGTINLVTLVPKTDMIVPSLPAVSAIFDAKFVMGPNSKAWFIHGNHDTGDGPTTVRSTASQIRIDILDQVTVSVIEDSFSDSYNIVGCSNSRPTVFDENAKQIYYPTIMRWGLEDQLNTNINLTNRFYPENYDEVDKSHGDIRRFSVWQRELRVFQHRRIGRAGIFARFLQQNDGSPNIVTTNEIITKNNIEYLAGEFGIGNQPSSLAKDAHVNYFADPVKGYFIRLSNDGLRPISLDFKVQSWASQFPAYLQSYINQFGGNANIVCSTWVRPNEDTLTFVTTQSGTNMAGNVIKGQTHIFNESKNAWEGFIDADPDSLVCAENVLYLFYNGLMYSLDNTSAYCNYFGFQNAPSISLVANAMPGIKKRWISITEVASEPWGVTNVKTEQDSYPGQKQESNILASEFSAIEGQYHGQFLNDQHSIGGIGNGDHLTGTYADIVLSPVNTSKLCFISLFEAKFQPQNIIER